MLHLVRRRGKDLAQQLFEPDFADRSPQLGHLEKLLDLGDRAPDGLEPLRHLAELPESLAHVRQHPSLLRAALSQGPRDLLLGGDERVEPGAQLDELLLEQSGVRLAGRPSQQQYEEEHADDGAGDEQHSGRGHLSQPHFEAAAGIVEPPVGHERSQRALQ